MPAITLAVEPLDLDLVDPHPRNPRRDLGDLTELTASIKTDGVRNPIHVGISTDGQRYVVLAGHRRREAAIAAGLATIPAIIRADVKTDAAALVEMAVENLLRADLTPIEEATLFEQLQIAGLKPPAIAKRTGRKRATVDARLALLSLPEAARDAVHGAQLSLDDAAALVEFADDKDEVARLIKSVGSSNFRWDLQNARNRRRAAQAREATRAALVAAGVTVVDQPDMWWEKSLRALPLLSETDLPDDSTREQVDEARRAAHADCPHHAAFLERDGSAAYVCLHPSVHRVDTAGSDDDEETPRVGAAAGSSTSTSSTASRDAAADREAMLSTQAKEREDCETAWGIRKDFIREHTMGVRAIPALAADALGRLFTDHALEFYVEVDPVQAATYIGLDLTEDQHHIDEATAAVRSAVEKRTGAQALLAALAAVQEDNLSRAGNWRTIGGNITPDSTERRWLDFLVSELDYELTEWEAQRLAAADQRAADLAAASEAEEAAGDDDDRDSEA